MVELPDIPTLYGDRGLSLAKMREVLYFDAAEWARTTHPGPTATWCLDRGVCTGARTALRCSSASRAVAGIARRVDPRSGACTGTLSISTASWMPSRVPIVGARDDSCRERPTAPSASPFVIPGADWFLNVRRS